MRRPQKVIHFLEGTSLRLVQEQPEEEGIGERADGEDQVVLPAWRQVSSTRMRESCHSPMFSKALGETWPMTKLASQLAIVVTPTALARMLFCMISTGLMSAMSLDRPIPIGRDKTADTTHMTQESGPMQDEKPKL